LKVMYDMKYIPSNNGNWRDHDGTQ
jgi:hypothetical protein